MVWVFSVMAQTSVENPKLKEWIEKANYHIDIANDSCLIYIQKIRDYAVKNDDNRAIVQALALEGDYKNFVKNEYNRSADLYLKAIEISEKNHLHFEKNLYLSLGRLFHMTDNYEKAKYYYEKALVDFRKDKDTLLLVKCLVNLGSIHSSTNHFELAEQFFMESLNYPSPDHIKRATYSNLGNLKIREEKFKEALPFLYKATVKDPKTGVQGDLYDFSYLLNAKTGAKSFEGIDSILKISYQLYGESEDMRSRSIMLKAIGETYYGMGQYQKAAQIKDQYIQLYDSLKAMQRDEIVYEMETKYQSEKKEQEIAKNEAEKERLSKQKKNLFALIVFAIGVILLLSYLIYLNIKQKMILKAQTVQLETLVDEKNILMKETHHRVKNSFQLVSSLLYLQSENIKNKEASQAIIDAQNRVKSMILIHQKMYSKDQLTGIDTKEYIEDLVKDIIENHTDNSHSVNFHTDVERHILSIETITSIGLIINELITNSLKHAFPLSVDQPIIEVHFTKQTDFFVLEVKDNGIGMQQEPKPTSFGLKLIHALAKKLKGKITFEIKNGTLFTMEIHQF
jgi:two-component sensor histidine kinase